MRLSSSDGIIVLSHHMDSQGVLNLESSIRADKAADIFRLNPGSKIITCGWDYRDDSNLKIGNSISNYLQNKHNISQENILTETNSRDTVSEAVFTRKNIVAKFNLNNLAIITSSYHLERAMEIFKFVYGDSFNLSFFGCQIKFTSLQVQSETFSLMKFRKTFLGIAKADLPAIYNRLLEKHPYYNGEIHYFEEQ